MSRSGFVQACLLLLILLRVPCVVAQTQPWRAGVAARKITPTERVYLAGYASRDRPFERIEDDLFVKALVLEDHAGARGILITADILGYRAEMTQAICSAIEDRIGVEPGRIILNASHTHTGPILTLDPATRANKMTAAQAEHSVAYTRELLRNTIEVAVEASQRLTPATLSFGSGVVNFVMNRREFTPRGVRLGVNARGLADRSVPMLRIDRADGSTTTPLAVVFGAACHNTTLGGNAYFVSGDFSGRAQTKLQALFPDMQAMFVQGCAGSANPYPRGTLELSDQHATELADEVRRLLQSDLRPIRGPLRIALESVDLPLQANLPKERIEQLLQGSSWQKWVAERVQEQLRRDGQLPTHYECPVSVWQFGEDLTWVGLSGEVVVDYVPLIEKAIGPRNLWISAYCHDVFGYIPSAEVIGQGGYETRGVIYSGIGLFKPEVQDVLVSHVRKLARQVGRKQ